MINAEILRSAPLAVSTTPFRGQIVYLVIDYLVKKKEKSGFHGGAYKVLLNQQCKQCGSYEHVPAHEHDTFLTKFPEFGGHTPTCQSKYTALALNRH